MWCWAVRRPDSHVQSAAGACADGRISTRPIQRRDFARGFAIQTVGPLPIAFAKQMMAAKGAWGWGMRRVMMDYNHWAHSGYWARFSRGRTIA